MDDPKVEFVEVIGTLGYEDYHYMCLTAMTKRRYRKRTRYLESALPRGLRKEVLFVDDDAVGRSSMPQPTPQPIRYRAPASGW